MAFNGVAMIVTVPIFPLISALCIRGLQTDVQSVSNSTSHCPSRAGAKANHDRAVADLLQPVSRIRVVQIGYYSVKKYMD
jgi:hypothetical protein